MLLKIIIRERMQTDENIVHDSIYIIKKKDKTIVTERKSVIVRVRVCKRRLTVKGQEGTFRVMEMLCILFLT